MDYYPFGMVMPGRSYTSTGYRFGFNGQEKDDEIKGTGNALSAEFWEYDSRLGERWNGDQIAKPDEGPYVCFRDNPLRYSDPSGENGLDVIVGMVVGAVTNIVPYVPAQSSTGNGVSTGPLTLIDPRALYTPTDPVDYNNALKAVDKTVEQVGMAEIAIGSAELTIGTGMMGGGAATMAGSAGAATPVAAPGFLAGGAVAIDGVKNAAVGGAMVLMAKTNRNKGYNYGKTQMEKTSSGEINQVPEQQAAKSNIHHAATNKNYVNGEQWSKKFEAIFKKAGYDLDDAINKVDVIGHKGPHPNEYHQYVFDKLTQATKGLSGDKYKSALDKALGVIKKEAATEGTKVNNWLTKTN